MSRLDTLKEQNPWMAHNNINVIHVILGSQTKYTELALSLIKKSPIQEDFDYIKEQLINRFKVPANLIPSAPNSILSLYYQMSQLGDSRINALIKFTELNEQKLINNTDLSTYKSFQDLENQIVIAELKSVDKELEKQLVKLYEDDTWLVIKPTSYFASLKYGASTKWCTAMNDTSNYFYRYINRGILIYAINKTDNFKVAAFKNLNPRYEKETSFWDVVDVRIDSLESGLPHEILNVFQQEFKTQDVTNWNLLSNEDKLEQLHQLKIKGKFPSDVDLEIQNAETTLVNSLRDVISNISRLGEIEAETNIPERGMEDMAEQILANIPDPEPYDDNVTVQVNNAAGQILNTPLGEAIMTRRYN